MFKPGEMVMHPRHGTGIVVEVKHLKITDQETPYYLVSLATGDKLLVPVTRDGEDVLIPVTRPEDINKALSAAPQDLSTDFRQRTLDVEKKIASGDSILVAEALRDLAWRRHSSKLSNGDVRLMEKARKALANMLASKPKMDLREAMRRLDDMLEEVVSAWLKAG